MTLHLWQDSKWLPTSLVEIECTQPYIKKKNTIIHMHKKKYYKIQPFLTKIEIKEKKVYLHFVSILYDETMKSNKMGKII